MPLAVDSCDNFLRKFVNTGTLYYWIGAICILSGIIYLISKTNFIRHSINEVKLRNKEFDERNKNNHE